MKILTTLDGSSTLVSDHFADQLYHSDRGAIGEAMHTYIRFLQDGDSVLEFGFGSGLNALLALQSGLKLRYTTIEHYPVDIDTAQSLSFACEELEALHRAPWGEWVDITPNFSIRKLNFDFSTLPTTASDYLEMGYSRVFFDAFAPDIVPEQWREEVFRILHDYMIPSGEILTYSSKGIVKQAMRGADFFVKRLPGALGKHNMVIATKLTEQGE